MVSVFTSRHHVQTIALYFSQFPIASFSNLPLLFVHNHLFFLNLFYLLQRQIQHVSNLFRRFSAHNLFIAHKMFHSCIISAPVIPDVYTSSFVSSRMISPLWGTGIILLYIDILAWKAKAYNSFSFHKKTNHCNIILYINTKNGGILRHFLYLFFFV